MIGYAVIGSDDIDSAGKFYDPIAQLLGARRIHAFDRGIFYGVTEFELAVVTPFNGEAMRPGNGTMVALKAPSRKVVNEVHALALETGGIDEGAPGIRRREESGFYGAYFRDPEGNKLCVYRMGPA
ncbi:VOC family protein [Hyphomonas johnsonii]|uniref:Dioxygenase n=1 Tax=Hyphomonas johnsonii MHS-2 TaxID=1280950 RepID=A0A059FU60_9PROT|nr:VOC family protein [Hyphomonas johnsonii]KCZ94245.1 dioxygenase [Hyphomonas johnsonii MHS-2]